MKLLLFVLAATAFAFVLKKKTPLSIEELNKQMSKHDLQVKSIIGNGNFGVTFSAVDESPANQLIVKRQKICEEHVNKYVKEAEIAKRISQLESKKGLIIPNKMFVQGKYFYYTMRRAAIDILSLASKLKALSRELKIFSESHFVQVSIDICTGISNLNRSNISHNDIKWANIVLTKSGRAKMIDFGESSVMIGDTKRDVAKTEKVLSGLLKKQVKAGENKASIETCLALLKAPTYSFPEAIECLSALNKKFEILPETKKIIEESMETAQHEFDLSGLDQCKVASEQQITELKQYEFEEE